MQGDVVATVLLPLILAFIMFALGLGLTPVDFKRIVSQPKALLIGVLCHFVLLPLVCIVMLRAWGLNGAFAVGFMILAACPTGTTSNLLTYLARGDVALALGFTAVASVLTVFTLPLIVSWALANFMGGEQAVSAPTADLMKQIALMLGVPVSAGMAVRHKWTAWAKSFEPKATRIATVLFVLIVAAAVAKNWALLRDNFGTLAPMAVALNVTMLGIGFGLAWLAKLSRTQAITLGIESAMQNATLALVTASTMLKDDAMAVPGAIYGVLMYVGGLVFALGMRRFTVESSPLSLSPGGGEGQGEG